LRASYCDIALGRIEIRKDRTALIVERSANFGATHAASRALEQAHAQARFKIGNVSADARLRDIQCSRGCREPLVLYHRCEILNVVQIVHGAPLDLMSSGYDSTNGHCSTCGTPCSLFAGFFACLPVRISAANDGVSCRRMGVINVSSAAASHGRAFAFKSADRDQGAVVASSRPSKSKKPFHRAVMAIAAAVIFAGAAGYYWPA
jgi:hypothetical protein